MVPAASLELTRENIRLGKVQHAVAHLGCSALLSDTARADSIADMLARRCPSGEVWLFGYGSLIWNPAFTFADRRVGRVHGWHRRFCLWNEVGRGTPDKPGLALGLEAGGSCQGIAFRIPPKDVQTELEIVWRREMATDAYRPRWITVRTQDGPVSAITFTVNRGHARYAGRLDLDTIARTIATAVGCIGPCLDYALNTVAALHSLGIADPLLTALRDRITEICGSQQAAAV